MDFTPNLKEESYYSDLYDRLTVNECRGIEERLGTSIAASKAEAGLENPERWWRVFKEAAMFYATGELYVRKKEVIRKWMQIDREKDELLEKAQPPIGIRCLICRTSMHCDLKELHGIDERDEEILFFFSCKRCKKRRAFFKDGTELRTEPKICKSCRVAMKARSSVGADKVTIVFECPKGHTETEVIDLTGNDRVDENFISDRDRFCLSEKRGAEYLDSQRRSETYRREKNLQIERERNRELYEEVGKLKKLNVAGLKALLTPLFESQGYAKLQLGKRSVLKDVQIRFSVEDSKADRKERESTSQLQKLIAASLDDTNWRLMSRGLSYNLGILSGVFRGYEREEDLLKLMEKKIKKSEKTA